MMQQSFSCCSIKLCGTYNTDTEPGGRWPNGQGLHGDETCVPYMRNQGSRIAAQPPAPRNGARVWSGGAADRRRKLSVEGHGCAISKGGWPWVGLVGVIPSGECATDSEEGHRCQIKERDLSSYDSELWRARIRTHNSRERQSHTHTPALSQEMAAGAIEVYHASVSAWDA
jgi:hypothetical protein